MAEGRVLAVKVQLDERSAKKAGDEAAKQMQTGLNQIQNNAREAGKKAGDALSLGIETGANRANQAIKALSVGLAALGGLQVFRQLGEQALQAAINIDKTRQAIAALTGGVDAANKKIAELRKLAAASPGVTTTFATQLYQQLRAVGTITDQTINKVIQSVGKLNAVFSLENPSGFARNIQQIFDQGFERGDIKEALGQAPIFEQLLQQAFGTKDPDKLRKLKEAGKLTAEAYYTGIIDAINQRFPKVSESIGAQFEKIKDQATTALEPLGKFLAEDILGAVEILGPSVSDLWERMKIFAAEVGPELQKALVESLKLTVSLIDSFVAFDKQTNVLSKLGFIFNALIGAQAVFLRGLTETVNFIRDTLTPVINKLLAGIEVIGRFGSALPGVGGAFGSAADAAISAYGAFNLNKAPGIITDNTRGKSIIGESASSL